MMDAALSFFHTTLRNLSLAAVRGDRMFLLALLIPFILLLFLLDWDYHLFIFLFLAYSSALLGFMVARSLGVLAQKVELEMAQNQPIPPAFVKERQQLEETIRHLTMELSMLKLRGKQRPSGVEEVQALMASHELKEPLRTIHSFIQLLHDRHLQKLDSEGQDFLHFIANASQRMQEMIHNVETFSGIVQPADLSRSVDLNFVVADVLRLLGAKIRESNAIIQVDELPCLEVDQKQFCQLLQNLIDNALKYRTTRIPVIHIRCQQIAGDWVFRVQDNGIGIEKEFHQVVFDLFRRLHGVGEYSGSGIGLSICQKIVDNHGGRIWVESDGKDRGSTFCFTLSREEPAPAIPTPSKAYAPGALKKS